MESNITYQGCVVNIQGGFKDDAGEVVPLADAQVDFVLRNEETRSVLRFSSAVDTEHNPITITDDVFSLEVTSSQTSKLTGLCDYELAMTREGYPSIGKSEAGVLEVIETDIKYQ